MTTKHAVTMFVKVSAVSCAIVIATGCAKREMVKGEEPVAASSVAGKEPVKPEKPLDRAAVQPAKEAHALETPEAIPGAGKLRGAMEKIYFDLDSHLLSNRARDILTKNAGLIKEDAAINVRIEGYCDERGSDEYNLALGEKRARAAMQYLVTMGVPPGRLAMVSFGEEKPAETGHGESAWARNRRDEFVIVE